LKRAIFGINVSKSVGAQHENLMDQLQDVPEEGAVLAEIDPTAGFRCDAARELNHRAFRTRRGTAWRLESVARVVKQGGIARAR
jgi:hypothetical protein